MLEPRPMPGRKPIVINNKLLNIVKQQGKGERKTFSAPVLSYIPPPAPKRRPTVPHIEPPPLSLTPASPDTNIGVHIKMKGQKKPERSLNDYFAKSCPAYAPFLDFGGPDDLNSLEDGGKDIEKVGKRVSQLSTITEKVGSLSSSPTIISLLHTERLSAPKGRSSSLSSVSSVRDQRTHSVEDSKSSGQEFDLFDLEQHLPPMPTGQDDLQFEMETGSEAQLEGESGEFLPTFT